MDPIDDGFDEAYANSWFELSKSDYARVIFCDLSPFDEELGVGCRFQITDNVHEDPCDYVGLYRVGWKHISEYIVFKLLSQIECEEDGKMLCCIFKGDELPNLNDGFYQFLYVTRDNEVCGASTPFEVSRIAREESSDEDVVADKTEDDFLVVRSNLFEKNHQLENKLAESQENIEKLQRENSKLIAKMGKITEENNTLQQLKESKDAALRSYSAQVESLESSVRNHKITNERYESHIMTYQTKIASYEKKAKKAEQEVKKFEDINCHLREQMKQLDKQLEEQRAKLKTNNSDAGHHHCEMRLENAKAMLRASEESKQLAMEEIKKKSLTGSNAIMRQTLVEKFALKLQLEDEKKCNAQMNKERKELEAAVIELNHVLKDKEILLKKTLEDQHELQERFEKLSFESNDEIKMMDTINELISKCALWEEQVTDLKSHCNDLNQNVAEKESSCEKMKDTINDLTSKCALWEEEVNDLKSHCNDLNQTVAAKESSCEKLKEECIKKDAVIEYLVKEKEQLQKAQISMNEALNEMGARLRMAAELYREQYLKINVLKKMKKSKMFKLDAAVNQVCSVCKSSQISGPSSSSGASFEAQNSDSDTGELVQGASTKNEIMVKQYLQMKKELDVLQKSENSNLDPKSTAPKACAPPVPLSSPQDPMSGIIERKETAKEEALHQMIEQNLANLSASCPVPKCMKDEEIAKPYTLPCAMCESMIEVYSNNTDEMIKHLEEVHKQQMCPVCGRLFDMTMPPNYFLFHVDDHYNCEKDKKSA